MTEAGDAGGGIALGVFVPPKKSVLMRVDPEFQGIVRSLKRELEDAGMVLSEREVTRMVAKMVLSKNRKSWWESELFR